MACRRGTACSLAQRDTCPWTALPFASRPKTPPIRDPAGRTTRPSRRPVTRTYQSPTTAAPLFAQKARRPPAAPSTVAQNPC
eukprot:113468-Pyramimonas_sp.AAC.1